MSLFSCKNCNKCSESKYNKEFSTDLLKIILVGNPNVGKSVIFNSLSGFYVEVSNYPGTTVDISRAFTEFGEIIDTPGSYILGNFSDDEIVTQNIIQTADIVINVASALSIERDLFFTQQLIDMDFPVILVINQIDEAEKRGVNIDVKMLESLLGIKVIPTIATQNKGIQNIINAIKCREYKISKNKTSYLEKIFEKQEISKSEKFLKILEIESHNYKNQGERDIIFIERRKLINDIVSKILFHAEKKQSLSEKLGDLLLNPVVGIIAALSILYLLFELIGVFISGEVVDFLFTNLEEKYSPWIEGIIKSIIPIAFINEYLVGEFGILTMTVKIVAGILMPLIVAFYFFMAILEDSGYLPRLAALTDNILNKLGLNGRAVIPLLLGFGCGAMGTITTRILGSKKERTIATAILGVTIPCAAQQGIIIALLAAIGGFKIWMLYLIIIFIIMVIIGTALNKIIGGTVTALIIDLPPIRTPVLYNIIHKTIYRALNFLKEAIPLFAVSSIFITFLNIIGFLKWLQEALSPVVVNLLHLPAEFSDIFVMGLIRRDFASIGLLGMAGLENSARMLNDLQILIASIVVTLFVPCLATLIVIYKERGLKEATLIWIGTFMITIITGTILTRVLSLIV